MEIYKNLTVLLGIIILIMPCCKKESVAPEESVPVDPLIVWEDPEDIYAGMPLTATHLNASSDVQGSFTYSHETGTILNSGAHELTADFTPVDTESYNPVSKTVIIRVYGTITDNDSNEYRTIVIGEQTWMAENLKSVHYSNGNLIPDVVSYDGSEANADKYGMLYSWSATMNGNARENSQGVCPVGWHVPSARDWEKLEDVLGGSEVAGGKLKTKNEWSSPNTGATNSSGFSALPGGEFDGHEFKIYKLMNQYAVFWTSTNVSNDVAIEKFLSYKDAASAKLNWYKTMKYSVRCIKD